jgi:hypothetical protein
MLVEPQLMVVDAVNVIGSWPDGRRRDRAAVRRLITALAHGLRRDEDVIVVLEGAARAGAGPGILDGIQWHTPEARRTTKSCGLSRPRGPRRTGRSRS